MIETKIKIYIGLIIFTLGYMNIFLVLRLNEQITIGKRFTYEDGVILYNFCEIKTGPKLKTMVSIYGEKNTDFKNYLLKKYED